MTKYKPEQKWVISDNLIYNLKTHGYIKGEPDFCNDVAINVVTELEGEERKEVMELILNTLNDYYFENENENEIDEACRDCLDLLNNDNGGLCNEQTYSR